MQISIPNIHLSYSICTAVWSPRHLNTLFRIHTINLLLYKKQPQYKPHYYLKLIAQKNLRVPAKKLLLPDKVWTRHLWFEMLSLSRGNNLSTVSMKKENLTPCGHCLSHLDVYNKILHQCLCVAWHTPPNLPWLKTWPISFWFNLQKKDWTYIPQSLLNDQSNHTAGRKFKRHLLQQILKGQFMFNQTE